MAHTRLVFFIILSSILFIFGVLHVVWPKKMWDIFDRWKTDGEPTEKYLSAKRFAGVVMILFVILMLVIQYA